MNTNYKTYLLYKDFFTKNYCELFDIYGIKDGGFKLSQQQKEFLKICEKDKSIIFKKYRQFGSTTLLAFIIFVELMRGKRICGIGVTSEMGNYLLSKVSSYFRITNIEISRLIKKYIKYNSGSFDIVSLENIGLISNYDIIIIDDFLHLEFNSNKQRENENKLKEVLYQCQSSNTKYILTTNSQEIFDDLKKSLEGIYVELRWWLDKRFNEGLYWTKSKHKPRYLSSDESIVGCFDLEINGWTPSSPLIDEMNSFIFNNNINILEI